MVLIPGWGRSPGEGNGNLLQQPSRPYPYLSCDSQLVFEHQLRDLLQFVAFLMFLFSQKHLQQCGRLTLTWTSIIGPNTQLSCICKKSEAYTVRFQRWQKSLSQKQRIHNQGSILQVDSVVIQRVIDLALDLSSDLTSIQEKQCFPWRLHETESRN